MSNLIDRLRALKKKKDPASGPDVRKPETEVEEKAPDSPRRRTLDRLRTLIRTAESRPPAVPDPACAGTPNGLLSFEMLEGPGQHIEDLIPGEYLATPQGKCFRVRTVYPWHHFQGAVPVSSLLDIDTKSLSMIVKDERLLDFNPRDALFFDTETTGLEMGAGTYIFLAGFGYFEERMFVVEQFFMRDFPEEPAVLHRVRELLERFRFIISFNGKTYDWPLLENRFIINRLTLPDPRPPHLDLLHIARRLYKNRLPDCRLVSIESGILGFRRLDDIPGALLPQLYFRYLRSRDARFIHKAFAHNAHDIVTLAAMTAEILRFLNEPSPDERWRGKDMFAAARIQEDAGDWGEAARSYRQALSLGLDSLFYAEALIRLSMIMKRSGNWDEAVELWQTILKTADPPEVIPYVELSKYYEHRIRNLPVAAEIIETALGVFESNIEMYFGAVRDLKYRLDRIRRKMAKPSLEDK